ncbi:hypothetical protein [Bradyrhizobium sp. SYSU BS000235]|uniref:hypothetical protein n=1 Tax=Bradyrhizobium sp. SYSU BS000235 TaxID=3411332 RepID=UPI003C76AA6D
MKHRGKFIIEEFELLRSVAGKSGLQLPSEITQGPQLFRKRDLLFKQLKLDPNNEHHVAFLCSIVYDHLYLDKPSPADVKFDDNKNFDLLVRLINHYKKKQPKRDSDLFRSFLKEDAQTKAEYPSEVKVDAFRMRVKRAAEKAINNRMKLTAKREARLKLILPDLRSFFEK